MKNILIVADVYPPEISSAANLMRELSGGLKNRGYNVWVLTSYPKHYLPQELRGNNFEIFSEENGVKIIRVKTLPLHKVNFIIRGISQLLLPFIFFRQARKFIGVKIDAVIVYSPPLPLALIGGMIKKRYGAKFILNIQDIFPQNAIDLGVLRKWPHWLAIWIFEQIEKRAYQEADKISFHSEGGRNFLIEKKRVPEEKIFVVYNWIDLAPYQNLTKKISFRKRWGLENKFIILFAGIMGPAQGMEFIADVAEKISDIKNVVFLLVGDGTEKEKVDKLIKERGLKNIIIKSSVSMDEYPYLVKEANVGLVCLSARNKTPFVPGKFLGYLAAGKPILAFLNKESDGFALVEKAHCGYAIVAGDLERAENLIRKTLQGNKAVLKELGENGMRYAEDNLSLEAALDKFERLISPDDF